MGIYNLGIQNFQVGGGGGKRTLNLQTREPMVLCFFKQQGCPACTAFEPIFAQLSKMDPSVSYGICDLSGQNRDIIRMSQGTTSTITAVPFLVMYVHGKPFAVFRGKKNIPSLRSFIDKVRGMMSQRRQAPPTHHQQMGGHHQQMHGMPQEEGDEELIMPQNVIPHNRPWNAEGRGGYATLD